MKRDRSDRGAATAQAWLRIGELARRAGVSRATVQHYVSEGLLPAPRKTGRTMAYYDPACLERIALIKELQRRYLPLGAIRRLLEAPAAPQGGSGLPPALQDLAAAGRAVRSAIEPPELPLLREEVPARIGVGFALLAELERIGLVNRQVVLGHEGFGPADVAILRAVAAMERSGLGKRAGFRPEDLLMYREAMQALLGREVALFTRQVVDGKYPQDLARLAIAAATCASDLLVALRQKLIADFLGEAVSGQARRALRKGTRRHA